MPSEKFRKFTPQVTGVTPQALHTMAPAFPRPPNDITSMQHTCDLVSTELSMAPVSVFQVLMQRSAVPPPLASRLLWKGHHASACKVDDDRP